MRQEQTVHLSYSSSYLWPQGHLKSIAFQSTPLLPCLTETHLFSPEKEAGNSLWKWYVFSSETLVEAVKCFFFLLSVQGRVPEACVRWCYIPACWRGKVYFLLWDCKGKQFKGRIPEPAVAPVIVYFTAKESLRFRHSPSIVPANLKTKCLANPRLPWLWMKWLQPAWRFFCQHTTALCGSFQSRVLQESKTQTQFNFSVLLSLKSWTSLPQVILNGPGRAA